MNPRSRRNTPHHADVVIVGGGMVGAACALALVDGLVRARLSVTLVEPCKPEGVVDDEKWDLRVSALSRASERILRNLNAWNAINSARVCDYQAMTVWDAGGSGRVHFDAADIGEPCLGHIVENHRVQAALWQQLEQHPDIQVQAARVTAVDCSMDNASVTLDSGRTVTSRLLVVADGAQSPTRDLLGIGVNAASYAQQGIVAVVTPEKRHGDVARQRFLATGPLALLPLADGRISIVWSADDAEAERLLALDDVEFLAELTHASEQVLGNFTDVSKRAAFPLRRQHAECYIGLRHVLVGDAAHVVHPLAGQGANLGFLDAATLAQVIADAEHQGRDIGSQRVLRRYERARRSDNLATLWTMDGFKRLFSNDSRFLATLRNTGFAVFDRIPPLKTAAMKKAMGLAGELPELARKKIRTE